MCSTTATITIFVPDEDDGTMERDELFTSPVRPSMISCKERSLVRCIGLSASAALKVLDTLAAITSGLLDGMDGWVGCVYTSQGAYTVPVIRLLAA